MSKNIVVYIEGVNKMKKINFIIFLMLFLILSLTTYVIANSQQGENKINLNATIQQHTGIINSAIVIIKNATIPANVENYVVNLKLSDSKLPGEYFFATVIQTEPQYYDNLSLNKYFSNSTHITTYVTNKYNTSVNVTFKIIASEVIVY